MNNGRQGHAIAGAFVFMLLMIFALLSLTLVLFGVKAYRSSIGRSDRNNETRLLSFYLRSVLRSVDEEEKIGTETLGGTDVLYYTENYDGEEYVTRIYSSGGMLREWFSERSREFKPEDGEPLFPVDSFTAKIGQGMVKAVLTGEPGGEEIEVDVALFGKTLSGEDTGDTAA